MANMELNEGVVLGRDRPVTAHVVKTTDDLAFNVTRTAYDFGLPGRVAHQILGAEKLQKHEKLDSMLLKGLAKCPPPEPSIAELSPDASPIKVLWVGMRPSAAPEYTQEQMSSKKRKEREEEGGEAVAVTSKKSGSAKSLSASVRGKSISSSKAYTQLEQDPTALRVVAPLGRANANYYVLINQDQDGLCCGIHVPIDEVFFFPEFRDDTCTAYQERLTKWGKIVREEVVKSGRVKYATNYDKTKFTATEVKKPIANELVALAAAYELSGSDQLLHQMMNILKDADPDGQYEPPIKNQSLYELVNGKTILDMTACERVVEEINVLWPDLSELKIEPKQIREVCRSLRLAKMTLEYRLLRAFIVEFCMEMSKLDAQSLPQFAVTTRRKLILQLGDVPPAAKMVVSRGAFGAFCSAEADKMRAILAMSRKGTKALEESQGDFLVADNLPQIWSTFGECPDVDSAKVYAQHVHRFNVVAINGLRADVEQELEKHADLCMKFASMAMEAEDGDIKGTMDVDVDEEGE